MMLLVSMTTLTWWSRSLDVVHAVSWRWVNFQPWTYVETANETAIGANISEKLSVQILEIPECECSMSELCGWSDFSRLEHRFQTYIALNCFSFVFDLPWQVTMQTHENKGAAVYSNGKAGHMNGTEQTRMKEVAFEKSPSEPMVRQSRVCVVRIVQVLRRLPLTSRVLRL